MIILSLCQNDGFRGYFIPFNCALLLPFVSYTDVHKGLILGMLLNLPADRLV